MNTAQQYEHHFDLLQLCWWYQYDNSILYADSYHLLCSENTLYGLQKWYQMITLYLLSNSNTSDRSSPSLHRLSSASSVKAPWESTIWNPSERHAFGIPKWIPFMRSSLSYPQYEAVEIKLAVSHKIQWVGRYINTVLLCNRQSAKASANIL